MAEPVTVSPTTIRQVATTDPRFQSYNVEMAEVIGGNFWKPYGRTAQNGGHQADAASSGGGLQAGQDPTMFEARRPIDLTNARLRKLATALGPIYVRVSGTWANTVYFHDADTPAPASPPKGFQGVLTRSQWKGVIDFVHAVDARLVTSFAIGAGVRDAAGVWTPDQARKLLAYTKAAGGKIAAAEFFNEPTMPEYGGAPAGYDATAYARDFAAFREFAENAAPDMKIVGPAVVGEDGLLPAASGKGPSILKTADILSASPVSDVFSYPLLRRGLDPLRVDGRGSADDRRGGAVGGLALARPPKLRVLWRASRPLRTGQADLDHRDRRCGLRRQSVGQYLLGHLPIPRSARALGQGSRERRFSQHARLERVWSPRSEHVRTASKLLGGAPLAPTHGTECTRSWPFSG